MRNAIALMLTAIVLIGATIAFAGPFRDEGDDSRDPEPERDFIELDT